MTRLLVLLLSLFLTASLGHGVEFPAKPPKQDFFVDNANLINAEGAAAINEIAAALLNEEHVALIVVTIPSLLAYQAAHSTIEQYATELFNTWKIGSETRNYGMLLLISSGDRQARIELGAAWGESYNQDAQQIMDTLIIPRFKEEDYNGGILAGVRGLDAAARGLALPKPETPWWYLPLLIGSLVLIVGLIISLFKSGRSGWGWALIAFLGIIIFFMFRAAAATSGSGGAFGGGSSGGGGASGSW